MLIFLVLFVLLTCTASDLFELLLNDEQFGVLNTDRLVIRTAKAGNLIKQSKVTQYTKKILINFDQSFHFDAENIFLFRFLIPLCNMEEPQ